MDDETKPENTRTRRKARTKDTVETVVQLFGTAPIHEDPRMDPDGIVPPNPGMKKARHAKRRVSVGARMAEVQFKIDEGTITMKEFVAALTPEELVRGQLKAHDGSFRGHPPRWVPAEFYQACIRELLSRGEEMWREAFFDSIKVFADIAKNDKLDPRDRLKAAQYVIERVAGKTPERVEISTVQPWEQIIGGIVAEAEDEAISRASRVLNGE